MWKWYKLLCCRGGLWHQWGWDKYVDLLLSYVPCFWGFQSNYKALELNTLLWVCFCLLCIKAWWWELFGTFWHVIAAFFEDWSNHFQISKLITAFFKFLAEQHSVLPLHMPLNGMLSIEICKTNVHRYSQVYIGLCMLFDLALSDDREWLKSQLKRQGHSTITPKLHTTPDFHLHLNCCWEIFHLTMWNVITPTLTSEQKHQVRFLKRLFSLFKTIKCKFSVWWPRKVFQSRLRSDQED